MHTKRMSKSDKLVILALVGIFVTGMAMGTILGVLISARNEPEAIYIVKCEAETEETAPANTEPAKTVEPKPEPKPQPQPKAQHTSLGEFKVTAYCSCSQCCGEWADGVTYTGTKATPGRTIAVDPDKIPLGSKVYIDGTEYIAEDIGGAIKGNRIDVLFPTHQEALQFGVKYIDVTIKK